MPRLTIPDGTSFELAGAEVLLGRGERDHRDPPKINVGTMRGSLTVSRRHARLREHSGRWYLLVELGSTNPTLVDGRLIPKGTEVPLGDGSRIQLGELALTFQGPAELPEAEITSARNGVESPTAPIVSVAPTPEVERPSDPALPASESWAARLPARPSALEGLGLDELRRVNPFRGLMIDESTWADAHDYHRHALRLHMLSAHGWGVVQGLEVVAAADAPDTVVVRPGAAIDQHGQVLLLSRELRLLVAGQDGQTRYVVARYGEETSAPQRHWSDEDEHTRIAERCHVTIERAAPGSSGVELARLVVTATVQDAFDPTSPRQGEIDLRFRERLAVRPPPELAVAQLTLPGDAGAEETPGHRLGLRFLMREIGLATPYRARWKGTVTLDDPLPGVSMLYFHGAGPFSVDDAALARLRAFLDHGGVLFADPCRGRDWRGFADSLISVAERLGLKMQPVVRWHPILTARHVLPEALASDPDGALLAEAGGVVLSTADYGCTWQGGSMDRPASREAIRASLELGTNVAVFARQKQRPLDLLEIEG
jgi:pSer/pThr/pTyr-binding forkhead associated (FHA) protein